ncbi:hypothetical protein ACWDWS_43820 [Streptomyces sp. NPDC003328]|uniref:hypothetical protein n=1 Tax=Streptomyces sp. NPDC003737 TaxID=3364685 RepID=UPI0036CDFBAF
MLLHTGTEQLPDLEDVRLASGYDIAPERVEQTRRLLNEEGAAGVEKLLPLKSIAGTSGISMANAELYRV